MTLKKYYAEKKQVTEVNIHYTIYIKFKTIKLNTSFRDTYIPYKTVTSKRITNIKFIITITGEVEGT